MDPKRIVGMALLGLAVIIAGFIGTAANLRSAIDECDPLRPMAPVGKPGTSTVASGRLRVSYRPAPAIVRALPQEARPWRRRPWHEPRIEPR